MASSPYRSKLLRFVSSQVRALSNQAAQTWRWAKVSVVWGVQIATAIAYGSWSWTRQGWCQIHAIAQGSVSGCLKLTEAVRLEAAISQIPTDTPIRKILARAEMASPPALNPPGLATDLATGRLTWVMPETQIVLREEDHRILQRQIVYELADYNYWQQRQRRITLWAGPIPGVRILALIWQAISYFFINRKVQSPLPPERVNGLGLVAASGSDPIRKQSQPFWQNSPVLENVRIGRWIQQAIHHFFGSACERSEEWENRPANLLGTSTFSLAILPGILGWGHSVVAWMRRTLGCWLTGSGLVLGPVGRLAQQPQRLSSSTFFEAPAIAASSESSYQVIISYPQATTITITSSPEVSVTWLDVPATVVGYERSLLVWLLTMLDGILVWLERFATWIWQKLHTWFASDR